MSQPLFLVRHPEINADWKGRCYGATDVPLSACGRSSIEQLAHKLAIKTPTHVIHSGLSRTYELAIAISERANCTITQDSHFAEMNFGNWEGRSWSDIFAEVGHDMARLIHESDTYAPTAGETVHALRCRVLAAIADLPDHETIIIVTHGGPISAVLGTLQKSPATEWSGLVPGYGAVIKLSPDDRQNLKFSGHYP